MDPKLTFAYGLALLVIFGWYFATDLERSKRILGSVLIVAVLAFCLTFLNPPLDETRTGPDGKPFTIPGKIHLGLDLRGGTSFLVRLDPPVDADGKKRPITDGMVNQAIEAIRKRVDQFNVAEPIIVPQGKDRILVQIPGLEEKQIDQAREQLRKVAKLEFRTVIPHSAQYIAAIEAGQALLPPGYTIETPVDLGSGQPLDYKLIVKKKTDLSGEHVTSAWPLNGDHGWEVNMEFDSEGAAQFAALTKQVAQQNAEFIQRGEPDDAVMAIVLDGKVISAPRVGPEFAAVGIAGGRAQISGGRMQEAECRALASDLMNPLQTPVVIDEERGASATLGADSIHSGIMAGVGGLALVLVFVVIYYRFAGLVAVVGLVANVVILFGVMAMFNFVLTLPGIAGVILTIGLAVDANVLIYERLREEMAAGKTLTAAVNSAYDKAFSVIFDANVTTLITAAILMWKATGPVKGFAVTLTVGIIASVFSAMVVTRTLFSWALSLGFVKRITMLHLISGKDHDFLGRRRLWMGISVAVIVIGIVGFAIRGDKNFGVDFKGGDLLMLKAKGPQPSLADVRKALEPLGYGESAVPQIEHDASSNKDYLSIRGPEGAGDAIRAIMVSPDGGKTPAKVFPEANFEVQQQDRVGKLVGGELATTSIMALLLGTLGILIYVTLRFEFSFAIGALVALLHDIVITVGVFALCGKELSVIMVGAILTIAGYSINDTIVVYDRIREGLRSGRKGNIQSIMNASINETLSRTLLTSGCTLLSVAALFFFGGPVLHDFAFAILIGIVVGTYSSIFIASPIVLWWSGRKGGSLQTEVAKPSAVQV